MRSTEFLLPTLKEIPKDAEAKSHILMLRAGMIRKLASGFYSYLPLGFKVLQKVEAIVRQEMNAAGALEVLLPAVHPVDIWKKTGRYDVMEGILFKIEKGDREYVLGPTHEEIITELAVAYIRSYKDMPKTLYQIQTKFRDEARPRFGVIRSREFIMKDAYSFDADDQGLDVSYKKMYAAYERIFSRCGLKFVVVEADTGAMGGKTSHEFMVLVSFGEDRIVLCPKCGYSGSSEVAACSATNAPVNEPAGTLDYFATPNVSTIEELTASLKCDASRFIKTILYKTETGVVACLVRGDHEVCEAKLAKAVKSPKLELADEATIKRVTGARVGFSGPVKLKEKITIIADHAVVALVNGITGANKDDEHIRSVNYGRDYTADAVADVRVITPADPCPKCGASITIDTSLEIGHVFKLGTKYTQALEGFYSDKDGSQKQIIMGCYGIGVNRILAAAIEQNYDEKKGMIWPTAIAPFHVTIITANQKSADVVKVAEDLYRDLTAAGMDVLFDDRDERMGVKFNDAELVGAPVFIVIGDKGLKENKIEIRNRRVQETLQVAPADVVDTVKSLVLSAN